MNTFPGFAASALLVFFASGGLAAQQEPAGSQSAAPQETPSSEATGHQGAAVDDEATAKQVNELRNRMQTMQQQMDRIMETDDPQRRKELMQQHRKSMREAMQMMNEMGSAHGQMMGGSGMGMMQGRGSDACPPNDTQCQRMASIESRQRTMMDQLQVMQMMMQQMMEYQSAEVVEVEE